MLTSAATKSQSSVNGNAAPISGDTYMPLLLEQSGSLQDFPIQNDGLALRHKPVPVVFASSASAQLLCDYNHG